MDLFNSIALHGSVAIVHAYVLCTVVAIAAFLGQQEGLKKLTVILIGVSIAVHASVITSILYTEYELSRAIYLHCLALGVLTFGWLAWLIRKFFILILFATPIALILTLISLSIGSTTSIIPSDFSAMFTVVHIATLFISFILMMLGFCAGVFFLITEQKIKAKTHIAKKEQKDIPSLNTLDRINSTVTILGFPLFSLGLLGGLIGARIAWGGVLFGDPKECISILIWGLFAWLFHQRLAIGWKGHKPAVVMVCLFLLCVFSLTVVNIFMNTHHSF